VVLEYFLYDTTYNNTLVDRSNISFAPTPPYDEIYIDYFIPETQPLYFYRESGGTIVLNQQSFIDEYINSITPLPTPNDYIKQSSLDFAKTVFDEYSATTANILSNIETELNLKASKISPVFTSSIIVNGIFNLLLDNSSAGNDTYTATNPNFTVLVGGLFVIFKPKVNNTGPCTLNLNGFGAKNILNRDYTTIANNDLRANAYIPLIYDGTSWILMW